VIETSKNSPIGVFDSGIGGLTVVKEIIKILPSEDIVHFGDTARLPYGSKSENIINKFSVENTVFLNSKNAKIIVIACNTASAVSLDYLRSFIKLPVIGVIESGAHGAIRVSRKKRVGVIGTKTTIKSGAYSKAIKRLDPDTEVFEVPTPLLVHLVEENWIEKDVTKAILIEYLSPLLDNDIDTLVLGCTHYPFLAERIREITKNISLIDAAEETALMVSNMLKSNNIISNKKNPATVNVYLSDMHPDLSSWANDFMGKDVLVNVLS
jgi:glutamate racemase